MVRKATKVHFNNFVHTLLFIISVFANDNTNCLTSLNDICHILEKENVGRLGTGVQIDKLRRCCLQYIECSVNYILPV